MKDIRFTPLPRLDGPVTRDYLELVLRDLVSKFDARNPQSDFAGAFLYANGVGTIGDDSKMSSQRPLPTVNAGNRLSAQTTNPLTSTGTSTTASITIASHVVQYGGFTVSYNGGTISGLTPLTTYFVYADDANLEGGAVAYSATLTPATVVASKDRYYVGQITTTNTTPSGNITGVTNANPCVVTVTGHPFNTGNSVAFSGVGGTTQLNGNTYTITKIDANTFSLDGIDSTAFGVFTSGGTATRVSSPTTGGGGGGGGSGWSIP